MTVYVPMGRPVMTFVPVMSEPTSDTVIVTVAEPSGPKRTLSNSLFATFAAVVPVARTVKVKVPLVGTAGPLPVTVLVMVSVPVGWL